MKTSFSLLACFVFLFTLTVFAQKESEKGIALYRSGDYAAAITALKTAVETNRKDYKAWTYLGAGYVRIQNYKSALEAFRESESASPKKFSDKELDELNEGFKITAKPRANYTDNARNAGTQGNVKFAVEFGGDGKMNFIFPVQALPNGLTENVVQAVQKIKYEPAQKDGKPVLVVKVITYNFTIY